MGWLIAHAITSSGHNVAVTQIFLKDKNNFVVRYKGNLMRIVCQIKYCLTATNDAGLINE